MQRPISLGRIRFLLRPPFTGTFGSVTFAGATPANYSICYLPVEAPMHVQFDILPSTPVRLQSFKVE